MHGGSALPRDFALPFGTLSDGLVAGGGVVPDDAVDMIHAASFLSEWIDIDFLCQLCYKT